MFPPLLRGVELCQWRLHSSPLAPLPLSCVPLAIPHYRPALAFPHLPLAVTQERPLFTCLQAWLQVMFLLFAWVYM